MTQGPPDRSYTANGLLHEHGLLSHSRKLYSLDLSQLLLPSLGLIVRVAGSEEPLPLFQGLGPSTNTTRACWAFFVGFKLNCTDLPFTYKSKFWGYCFTSSHVCAYFSHPPPMFQGHYSITFTPSIPSSLFLPLSSSISYTFYRGFLNCILLVFFCLLSSVLFNKKMKWPLRTTASPLSILSVRSQVLDKYSLTVP